MSEKHECVTEKHEKHIPTVEALQRIASALEMIASEGILLRVSETPEATLETFEVEVESDLEMEEQGLTEFQVIEQMEKLRNTGIYEEEDDYDLRKRAIEILLEDIPF